MDLQLVCWNICGLSKLHRFPSVFSFLVSSHVLFLQETLQVTQSFQFPGFTRFDVPAIATNGRASGGLCVLFANSAFGSHSFEVLFDEPYLLLIATVSPSGRTSIFGNVYIPRFSGTSPTIYSDVLEHIIAAVEFLSPASIVIAGDWNAHPHAPTSPFDRAFIEFENELRALGRFFLFLRVFVFQNF